MADTKLTALAALTDATTDDLIYIVDDPTGTPASKQITVGNLLKPSFLTLATSAGVPNERVLTPGTGIAGTDAGAGSTYTVASKSAVLYQTGTDVSVVNTTTETSLFSMTIPGNALGSHGAIKAELLVTVDHAIVDNLTMRVKYGSATFTCVFQAGVTSATKPGRIWISITGDGATNAQYTNLEALLYDGNSTTVNTAYIRTVAGTSAIDSTADQTLQVTAQWATANAGLNVTLYHVGVTKEVA